MADRILEFLSNLLKIGKEQLMLKGEFLRNKVPINPVLGLTGLGVLLMAVRPLLTSKEQRRDAKETNPKTEGEQQQQQQQQQQPQQDGENEYTLQKTLYLMREKEKLLRKQEAKQMQQQIS